MDDDGKWYVEQAKSWGMDAERIQLSPDLRVAKFASLKSEPGDVFVDASTLIAAARTLKAVQDSTPNEAFRNVGSTDIQGALNLLQTIVIHQRVFVDAVSLAHSSYASEVASQFGAYLHCVAVTDANVYDTVWKDIDRFLSIAQASAYRHNEHSESIIELFDRGYASPGDTPFVNIPDRRHSETFILVYGPASTRESCRLENIPNSLRNSNMGEPRTIFYLRLACEAKCAYVAHPTRAKFLERATAVLGTGNPSTTTADALVERFDESVARRDGAATVFPVPPVAEYLLQRSRSKTELLEELARARKAAQPFRSWCAALENAHRTRAGTAERLRLERQFASALSAWQKDPYDGVRYKRRSIKFSAPLKFLGIDVDGGEIKDPILLKRYTGFRPLLFLNSMINDDVAGGRTLFELLPQE